MARLDEYADLLSKKAFAHLATLRPDGTAHVSPVWVDFDGTHVRSNTARGRAKARQVASRRSTSGRTAIRGGGRARCASW